MNLVRNFGKVRQGDMELRVHPTTQGGRILLARNRATRKEIIFDLDDEVCEFLRSICP